MSDEPDTELVEEDLESAITKYLVYPYLYAPVKILREYLNDNAFLFTLIGVFGAISIYSRQAGIESRAEISAFSDFGFVAGFSLVVIISVVTLIDLAIRIRRNSGIYRNLGLWAFALFFVPLMFVAAGFVSPYREIWAGYQLMGAYIIGLVVPGAVVVAILVISKGLDEYLGLEPILSTIGMSGITIGGFYLIVKFEHLSSSVPSIEDGYSIGEIFTLLTTFTLGGIALFSFLVGGILLVFLGLWILKTIFSWVSTMYNRLMNV